MPKRWIVPSAFATFCEQPTVSNNLVRRLEHSLDRFIIHLLSCDAIMAAISSTKDVTDVEILWPDTGETAVNKGDNTSTLS